MIQGWRVGGPINGSTLKLGIGCVLDDENKTGGNAPDSCKLGSLGSCEGEE